MRLTRRYYGIRLILNLRISWLPNSRAIRQWMDTPRMLYGNIGKKGDDQEVITNEELSDSEDGNLSEEEEFNYLLRIDADVLTKDILGFKIMENTKMIGFMNRTTKYHGDKGYCNGGHLPGAFQAGNTLQCQDYEWYEALEESDLKDETLRNKAALEESMNHKEESSNDDWSHYSPIDEWEYHEHDANIEADVNSNYKPYFYSSRLFNNHTKKNDDKDVQDGMELNKDADDDVGYVDDYLVHGNAPFINDKEEERTKKRRCKLLGILFTKPPACKMERKFMSRLPRYLPQNGRRMVGDKDGVKSRRQIADTAYPTPMDTAY
ncbi:hypothetical protein Tco_0801774 [Tanacetum coccineum]|uniref:Uncharacterized protein n=1 Tax=Tanacetum coccineum TaxID=301880 RepID=A0ABQ4ZZT1_9ASTR